MQHAVRSVPEALESPIGGFSVDVGGERRESRRVAVQQTVRYRLPDLSDSQWSHGVILNLSESGGSFLVDGAWRLVERIEAEEFVAIEIELHDLSRVEPLRLRGEVVWVQPDGGGAEGVDRVGARFRELPVCEAVRLGKLLEALVDD